MEECLQTAMHQGVLERHWLCSVLLGAVALLICTFANQSHVVQGSNLKKSCGVSVSTTAVGLRHGSVGLSIKP